MCIRSRVIELLNLKQHNQRKTSFVLDSSIFSHYFGLTHHLFLDWRSWYIARHPISSSWIVKTFLLTLKLLYATSKQYKIHHKAITGISIMYSLSKRPGYKILNEFPLLFIYTPIFKNAYFLFFPHNIPSYYLLEGK